MCSMKLLLQNLCVSASAWKQHEFVMSTVTPHIVLDAQTVLVTLKKAFAPCCAHNMVEALLVELQPSIV